MSKVFRALSLVGITDEAEKERLRDLVLAKLECVWLEIGAFKNIAALPPERRDAIVMGTLLTFAAYTAAEEGVTKESFLEGIQEAFEDAEKELEEEPGPDDEEDVEKAPS